MSKITKAVHLNYQKIDNHVYVKTCIRQSYLHEELSALIRGLLPRKLSKASNSDLFREPKVTRIRR